MGGLHIQQIDMAGVSMRSRDEVIQDFTRQWFKKAETDLLAAQTLAEANSRDYFPSAFHSQQACEKFLKAYLVRHQIEFRKTHDLGHLLNLISRADPKIQDELNSCVWLTPYGVEFRYPGEFLDVNQATAREALAEAKKVRSAILERLKAYLSA